MFAYLLPPIALAIFFLGIALIVNTIASEQRGYWGENIGTTLVISSVALGWLLGGLISITIYGLQEKTMGHYKIQCEDLQTFIKTVSGLMKEGACFESNADRLTIELTGGY